ncbi:MAG: glycoside hydrolase family 5 protein [Myxococcales bacterium]|nr:glycoside hydrolase family 5 protein [Myxococcales bacterium]
MRLIRLLLCVSLLLVLAACDDDYEPQDQYQDSLTRVHVQQTFFKDQQGRYLYLNGINLADPKSGPVVWDPISYVGKPFPVDELDKNFRIIQQLGFNSVRFLIQWEAIEPDEKGVYDEEYLDYLETAVAKAGEYGIYCLIDMHQDMFSRHLLKYFNDGSGVMGLVNPAEIELAERYGYNNKVNGDGAPRWVVQAALPEKNVGGPKWGLPYALVDNPNETSDVLPWTSWFLNVGTSLDENRCYAALFAGDVVWPDYFIDGQNLKDYLQEAYANSFAQVAKRLAGYDNVLGYDIINEPGGVFIMLTLYALLYREAAASPSGELTPSQVEAALNAYLKEMRGQGFPEEQSQLLRAVLLDYDLLPHSKSEIESSGFIPAAGSPYRPNLFAAIALNANFNKTYLQPFYERIGAAIQHEDPNAIIFFETITGLPDKGISGQWAAPMTPLQGIEQQVYAPHKYVDIYPNIGFNQPPRDFEVGEIRFRDYEGPIDEAIDYATYSLGNPPVVLGEFGAYFNFGGIDQARATGYELSQYIIDPYYEVYEKKLMHRMIWAYSHLNNYDNGDGWNKEDFSVVDPDLKPRGWQAYSRAVPRFTSGRLLSMHFYSPLHYFEPRPNEPTPYLEFAMEMASKETTAPTEIYVPPLQYTDGFYVRISDGRCYYDPHTYVLYWFPAADDPATVHDIRIRPPYADYGDEDWDYFFNGDQVIEGVRS